MIVFPNAKINLGLFITGRRPDGYHDLETVMIPVGWHDVLEIVPAQGQETTLTVYDATFDCPAEKNLVMRAYRLVAERYGLPPLDIYLKKNIPDGAGLGGGSADAAFTVRLLNEMFSLGMSDSDMAAMIANLGADCPFFIYDKPMFATGTGTDLQPIELDLAEKWIYIVKPEEGVSTKEAYSHVTPDNTRTSLKALIEKDCLNSAIINDFEASVFPLKLSIQKVKETLLQTGPLYVSMSGSGSAVYAIYNNEQSACSAARLYPTLRHIVSKLQ